jgi:hypothetical protein
MTAGVLHLRQGRLGFGGGQLGDRIVLRGAGAPVVPAEPVRFRAAASTCPGSTLSTSTRVLPWPT